MINIKDRKNCCGCHACVTVCAKHCITMQEDKEGLFDAMDTWENSLNMMSLVLEGIEVRKDDTLKPTLKTRDLSLDSV